LVEVKSIFVLTFVSSVDFRNTSINI